MKRYFTHSALGSKPTTVIPNGVDLSRFEGLDPQAARSELDIPQDARVILFIGNMTIPVKGHRELLKIARRIVEEQNDVWLIFVGRHREPPAGHERIRYTGAVPADRIPGILAAADVFAFPSHAEYAPLVVLEAMAAGTPPVAYDVGGVPEQIVDAETGFVVEQENETEFEAKLRWLNDDADLRRSMGAAARKRAQEHFSVDLQVERTERLYEDVVARSGATRQEHGV